MGPLQGTWDIFGTRPRPPSTETKMWAALRDSRCVASRRGQARRMASGRICKTNGRSKINTMKNKNIGEGNNSHHRRITIRLLGNDSTKTLYMETFGSPAALLHKQIIGPSTQLSHPSQQKRMRNSP